MISSDRGWQSVLFFGALVIYAGFSSPTPDHFGLAEVLVVALLAMAVRMADIKETLFASLAFAFGLALPVLSGVIRGNEISDMIRDIFPFLFLFMPLFYGWIMRDESGRFFLVMACVGIIFSLRTIWAYQDVLLSPSMWGQGPPADLLYLANSPEVLFSALYCAGKGGGLLFERRDFIAGSALISLSILPVVAMALMMQRAGLGFFVLTSFIWSGLFLYFYPRRALGLFGILAVVGCLIWPIIEVVVMTLWQKTELVGLNSRAQEWSAVLDILNDDWTIALFGEGWGGRIENPAVGGLRVNYTHSLFSSLLLKTGIVGGGIILWGVFLPIWRAVCHEFSRRSVDFVLVGALMSPLLISTFLYASYKSLGFGLILLAFSSFFPRKLEKNPASVP